MGALHQIVRHPVEMIEMSHNLCRKLIPVEIACFFDLHGAVIVAEAVPRVQLRPCQ
jgi:hypothetical protein